MIHDKHILGLWCVLSEHICLVLDIYGGALAGITYFVFRLLESSLIMLNIGVVPQGYMA